MNHEERTPKMFWMRFGWIYQEICPPIPPRVKQENPLRTGQSTPQTEPVLMKPVETTMEMDQDQCLRIAKENAFYAPGKAEQIQ